MERIERLAQCLRCDPLCPPPLHGCDGPKSVKAVEGFNSPLVHCAFDGCSWVSDALPCRRVSTNEQVKISCVVQAEWSTVACRQKIDADVYGCCGNENCLKEHIIACHRDVIVETCGQDINHPLMNEIRLYQARFHTNSSIQFLFEIELEGMGGRGSALRRMQDIFFCLQTTGFMGDS